MYTYLCLKNAYQLVSYLWPVVTYTMTSAYALPLAYYTGYSYAGYAYPIAYAYPYALTYYLSAYAWWFAYYAF